MNIKDLLMPFEEKNRIGIVKDYPFTIAKKGQNRLVYCGVSHSNDSKHPQNESIRQRWMTFLEKTDGQRRVAMVEGGLREIPDSVEGAVSRHGEAGLLTYLAKEAGVGVVCPEPRRSEEYTSLIEMGYTPEQVEYYYFARNVSFWGHFADRLSFERYLAQYFNNLPPFHLAAHNLDNMRQVHADMFGGEIREHDLAFFDVVTGTNYYPTAINQIARDCAVIRDAHIVQQIKQAWDEGKSVFVVFGATHAVIQEPALRKLLT